MNHDLETSLCAPVNYVSYVSQVWYCLLSSINIIWK